MLSVKALAAGRANYYLSLTVSSYYVDAPEPMGRWYGLGAQAFGLSGDVRAEDLERMCEGFDPRDPSRHVRNAGVNEGPRARKHGDDLCWSAPKSLSCLWALSSPEIRAEIEKKMDRAVKDALDYMQDHCFARVGAQGQELARVPLAFALFEHCSSRAGDPNLHVHAVCPNLVLHEDKKGKLRVTALDSTNFYHLKMTAGALFRASLAVGMQELGFEVERDRFSFRLKGFSEELCEHFSKRRAEIVDGILKAAKAVENLSQLDAREVLAAASGKMAELVTLSTRREKKEYTREQLFPVWRDIARELGVSQDHVQSLRGEVARPTPDRERAAKDAAREKVFGESMGKLVENFSHFAEKDFVRTMAEEAQCRGLTARDVRELAEHKIHHKQIIKLSEVLVERRDEKANRFRERTEARFTTEEMLLLEGRLLASVERMAKEGRAVDPKTVEAVIGNDERLSGPTGKEQAAAVRLLTTGEGRIACMTGKAGTGKSTTLQACRLAWELGGRKVVGCALAGDAADELQRSAGIESHSLARTLFWVESGRIKLTRDHVVVLDEAGMVSTRMMERLVGFVERAGAKLVLAGDAKQLQAIGAGGPFKSISERLGEAGHCVLTKIFRQAEKWRRETVVQFSEGLAREALATYLAKGQLTVTKTREEAIETLVGRWKADDGVKNPKDVLLLASLNAEVNAINRMCQEARREAGLLGEERLFVGGDYIHRGDRVRLGLGKGSLKLGVKNGFRGVVVAVAEAKESLVVRLDKDGREVRLSVEDFGAKHIRLGYATTVHGSQGKTVESCHVLMGGHMDDLHLGYVQASRSRGRTTLVVDQAHAGPELRDVARSLSRDRTKDLARDLLPDQLPPVPAHLQERTHHRQAGRSQSR